MPPRRKRPSRGKRNQEGKKNQEKKKAESETNAEEITKNTSEGTEEVEKNLEAGILDVEIKQENLDSMYTCGIGSGIEEHLAIDEEVRKCFTEEECKEDEPRESNLGILFSELSTDESPSTSRNFDQALSTVSQNQEDRPCVTRIIEDAEPASVHILDRSSGENELFFFRHYDAASRNFHENFKEAYPSLFKKIEARYLFKTIEETEKDGFFLAEGASENFAIPGPSRSFAASGQPRISSAFGPPPSISTARPPHIFSEAGSSRTIEAVRPTEIAAASGFCRRVAETEEIRSVAPTGRTRNVIVAAPSKNIETLSTSSCIKERESPGISSEVKEIRKRRIVTKKGLEDLTKRVYAGERDGIPFVVISSSDEDDGDVDDDVDDDHVDYDDDDDHVDDDDDDDDQ